MPDINFSCPACRAPLVIDESGAGKSVNCPKCGISINVSVPQPTEFPKPKPDIVLPPLIQQSPLTTNQPPLPTAPLINDSSSDVSKSSLTISKGTLITVVVAGTIIFSCCFCSCLGFIITSNSRHEIETGEISDDATSQNVVTQSDNPGVLTKKQFIQKMRSTMTRGVINDNLCNAVFENHSFKNTFGDPDSDVAFIDYKRLWSYRCSDGLIQFTVILGPAGMVIVQEINQY